MLQIIGWLMCGYLVVKAFELFGHARNGAENARTLYYVGGGLSLLLAPVFFFMMNAQVSNSNSGMQGLTESSSRTGSSDAWNNLEAAAGQAAAKRQAAEDADLTKQADDLERMANELGTEGRR